MVPRIDPATLVGGGGGRVRHATFVFRLHLQLMPSLALPCLPSRAVTWECAHLLFLLVSLPNMAASTFRREQTLVSLARGALRRKAENRVAVSLTMEVQRSKGVEFPSGLAARMSIASSPRASVQSAGRSVMYANDQLTLRYIDHGRRLSCTHTHCSGQSSMRSWRSGQRPGPVGPSLSSRRSPPERSWPRFGHTCSLSGHGRMERNRMDESASASYCISFES